MSANVTPRPWKWTRASFTRLAELGFFDQYRVELVSGEIIDTGSMKWPHVVAVELVGAVLRGVFATGFWVTEQKPFAAGDSLPVPDVAVYTGSMRDYADIPAAAALLVEVADSTLTYDTTTKAELYATAGVPEYWVLDLDGRCLHVFRDPAPLPAGLGATTYRSLQVFDAGGSVSPLAAPNATVAVADLLP
jgi:Uma2 family endonuclease